MLRSMKDLGQYAIGATDGPIGQVKDFYFDDEAWVIRYLVVETGSWLSSRKVLISPMSIRQPDWAGKLLPVAITRAQVENSPDIDTDKPVSRQHELEYLGYYGYPYYWGGEGLWGEGMSPYALMPLDPAVDKAERRLDEEAMARAEREHQRNDDPHLRSCQAVVGYHIHASDGEIGHVSGLLVDEATWAIRYLVVDTSNWWMGKQILLSPHWVERISWAENLVFLTLPREAIKNSPEWKPDQLVNREYEVRLYDYYGRPAYWADAGKDDDDSRVAGAPPKVL